MNPPRITAEVDVSGSDYDALCAAAALHAVGLLGPDRTYWLELREVRPVNLASDGPVGEWVGIARISAPYDAIDF